MLIVGEITYQLRSSLDLAAVALARHCGAVDVSRTYFPFASSEAEFLSAKGDPQKKMSLLPAASRAAISELKPYPKGNDLLIALGRLGNTDKHIQLITSASMNGATNLTAINFSKGSFATSMLAGQIFGVMAGAEESTNSGFNDGFEFDVTHIGTTIDRVVSAMQDHTILAVDVCFAGQGFFENEPVISTLHQLCGHVSDIPYIPEASIE